MENLPNRSARQTIKERVAQIYYTHGLFCASHPYAVFCITLFIFSFCCYPLLSYQMAGNAPLEYVIPLAHYHNHTHFVKTGNRSHVPRWFVGEPVSYVQQIIVKSAVSPWKANLIPSDAFRSPLSTVFSLLEATNNFQISNGSHKIGLSNLCAQVGEASKSISLQLSQYSCFILSPSNLWSQDYQKFQADPNLVATIYQNLKNSANFNTNINEIIFGVPWKETGLKKYYMRSRQRVITYAITIILKEYNQEFMHALKNYLLKIYNQNESNVDHNNEIIQIHYETQYHVFEFIPLGVTYLILFLYIYFSVRKIEHVKSKWALAMSAVTTVIASLLMSVSLCARFGLSFTLNGGEIFPYLVVIIGLENMLVLTNSVVSTPGYLDVKIRVAQGLSKEGWSITKNLITELCILLIGFFTFVPAIQEFCLFAVVGFLTDLFLQLVFFSTMLSIDIRGMELSDIHGHGFYQNQPLTPSHDMGMHTPIFRCPISMSTKLYRSKSAPKLQHSRAHSDVMVHGTQGSYSSAQILVPKRLKFIYFWARTRIVQKFFMFIMIIWITAVVYKFVVVCLSPNYLQDFPTTFKFESLVSRQFENIMPRNISFFSPTRNAISESSHYSAYFKDNNYNWRQLSNRHWPTVFGLYNISIYGKYVSLLPPIKLSLSINPEDALKQRHPEEAHIYDKLKSLWSSGSNEKLGSPSGEEVWYDASDSSFGERKEPDILLFAVLAIPSILLLVYVMVILYQCICSRNYAQWRSSWHPDDCYGDRYSQTVHVETLPKTLRGHRQEVECIAVTGSHVASSCLAGEIIVWDSSTGECLTIIKRRTPPSSFKINESTVSDGADDVSSDYESSSPNSFTQSTLSNQLASSPATESQYTCEELYANIPDLSSTINTDFSLLPQKRFSFDEFKSLLVEHQIKSKKATNLNKSKNVINNIHNCKKKHIRSHSVGQYPLLASAASFISSEPVVSSSHVGNSLPIWCLDFENSLIVAGCADGNIEFWDSASGSLLFVNQQKASGVTSVKIVGNIVIAARLSGSLDFLIVEKQGSFDKEKYSSPAYNRGNKKFKSLTKHDKNDLISSSENRLCHVYQSVHAHQQPINVLAIEGGRVVTGSSDQTLKILRVEDGCVLLTLHGHSGAITAIHIDKLAPTAAASGSDDGTVCMWDLMTGACIYQLRGHPNGSVLALLYTHTHVISTGTDNRICIWERQQGHLLHALHLSQSYCNSIMMLTSNVLVTAKQGSLVLWDINEGEPIRIVKLGDSDSSVSVHQMKPVSTGVIVEYGQHLKVIPFPTMTEKVD